MESRLKLLLADGYERKMYIEVCQQYIEDLNREIEESAEIIRQEIKE